MSYSKYYLGGWQDGSSGGTPITADALNHLEQGIIDANSSTLERVTDCNNATDPLKIYYTNADVSNLNRPINNWCIIRSLFLNGNPLSGNSWSCMQLGMPMNASVPRLFVRCKLVDGGWSAWKEFTLGAVS